MVYEGQARTMLLESRALLAADEEGKCKASAVRGGPYPRAQSSALRGRVFARACMGAYTSLSQNKERVRGSGENDIITSRHAYGVLTLLYS